MKDWIVEQGSGGGIVRHEAPPRFAARWTLGDDPDEIAAIEGPCWTDEGSGGADAIHIHGFEWTGGKVPDQDEFTRLMRRAGRAIDEWIAGRF